MNQPHDTVRTENNIYDYRDHEWAVILAGGDGTRLKSLTVRAFIDVIESALPALYGSFARLSALLGSCKETAAIDEFYAHIGDINFSHQVLALQPERLAVLKVSGIQWNDLGEPKRVMAWLNMAGIRPRWADAAVSQCA